MCAGCYLKSLAANFAPAADPTWTTGSRGSAVCDATCQLAFISSSGIDYNGNDLAGDPVTSATTVDACTAACYNNTACQAFTYTGSMGRPHEFLLSCATGVCMTTTSCKFVTAKILTICMLHAPIIVWTCALQHAFHVLGLCDQVAPCYVMTALSNLVRLGCRQ